MFTAPNGMNLRTSVTNPTSRFNRIRRYLSTHGPATKRDIFRDVFNKTIGIPRFEYSPTKGWVCLTPNVRSRGWGSYVFNLAVKYGYITKTRKGNAVFYSVV